MSVIPPKLSSPAPAERRVRGFPPPQGGFSSHHAAFTVPGKPLAWARARTHNGKFYTDPVRRSSKVQIGTLAKLAMGRRQPFVGAIVLTVRAYFAVPKSWPKWMQKAALAQQVHPTIRPDGDNLLKQVGDALNGVAWLDDCQVISAAVHKHYGEEARTEVEVFEVITEEVVRR